MQHTFKRFISTMSLVVFGLSIMGTFSIPVALAAAGEGTATLYIGTGGTNASDATYTGPVIAGTVNVGTKSYIHIALAVGATGINAAENNITAQINTNLFGANAWQTVEETALADLDTVGEWFVNLTDVSEATNNDAISFAASAAVDTGLITLQADQDIDATDIIHIYGVVQDDHYALAAANVAIQTDDTGADGRVDLTAGLPTIATVAAPQLTASIALAANSVVGTAGNTTLTMTFPRALANTDTVVFTMPTNFSIPNGAITSSETFGGAGTFACTGVAGTRVITCTASGVITGNGEGTLVMEGIQSLWDSAAATNVADLTVNDVATGAGADIALDATVAVADTTPETQLTASIALGDNSVVGTAGNTTLTLTLPRALAATDTIVFTMPTNFSIPNGAITVASETMGGAGVITCSGVSATRVVTCVTNGVITGDAAGTIVLEGMLSLWDSAGATNVADLTVNDNAAGGGLDMAVDATVAVADTTAATLTSTNVEPASLVAGTTGSVPVTFTTINALPNNGVIKVTFGSGFNVGGANTGACSSQDGTFVTTVSGQTVIITRQADGASEGAGAQTCTIAGIRNPTSSGTTGTYTISTYLTGGTSLLDTDAAVTADTITGGGGSSSDETPSDITPPSNVSVSVVGAPRVPTASVQLTLAATGATEMLISNSSDYSGGTWEAFTTVKSWTLTSGAGLKTVYVEFRDAAHNVSTAQTNVTVDVTAPTPEVIEEPAATQETEEVGTPDETTGFTDTADSWAVNYINELFTMGAVSGKTSTTFAPNDDITRAEMVKIAVLTFDIAVTDGATPTFTDVSASDWYAKYLAAAQTAGIISGYADGTFLPNSKVNRAEALKIVLEASGLSIDGAATSPFTDVVAGVWYAKYVNYAYAQGIISGKSATLFAPEDNITRAEMAKVAVKTADVLAAL